MAEETKKAQTDTSKLNKEYEDLKENTLQMLISLAKELDQLESKKAEFAQLFQSYLALATPKERQIYHQMMGNVKV